MFGDKVGLCLWKVAVTFTVLCIFCTWVYIVWIDHWKENEISRISRFEEIVGVLILIALATWILPRVFGIVGTWSDKTINPMVGVFLLLLFGVQMCLVYAWKVPFVWNDLKVTHSVASEIVTGVKPSAAEINYFTVYQNNSGLVLIYEGVYRITSLLFHSTNIKFAMIFNSLIMNIGIVFMIKTGGILWGKKGKVAMLMLSGTFGAFILYAILPYSDTLAFTIVSVLLYMVFAFPRLTTDKKRWRFIILFGIVFGIGLAVKGSLVILVMGILLGTIISPQIRTKVWAHKRFFLLSFVLVIGLGMGLCCGGKAVLNRQMGINQQMIADKGFPLWHWVMLGSSENGTYSRQDFNRTASIKGSKEKTVNSVKVAISRYSSKSPKELTVYLLHKNAYRIWHGGNFFYGFAYNRKINLTKLTGVNRLVMEIRDHDGYVFVNQILWEVEMLLVILGLWWNRNKLGFFSLVPIILISANIFFNVWEANGRYLFQFVPVLFLLMIEGGKGYFYVMDKAKKRRKCK